MQPAAVQQHRSRDSSAATASAVANTASTTAAFLLQQLGSAATGSGNPAPANAAVSAGSGNISRSHPRLGVPASSPEQQQQHPYRLVLPQQQDSQPSQVVQYSPSMASTMMGGLSIPSSAMTPSNNIHRMAFADRERQIKRRTKTGCMTCRKRRIKCDEGKPTCLNCQKSRRECEGYQVSNSTSTVPASASSRSESTTPPSTFHAQYSTDFNALAAPAQTTPTSGFSPINARRLKSPRFTPYDVYPRTPVEHTAQSTSSKDFDPWSGSEYLATEFANVSKDLHPEFTSETQMSNTSAEELSTPPPTARISIDSLLNLSSAALVHPPIDAPLNALFSPTTNLLPAPLLRPHNAGLFAHWINILSAAMGTLDRFPADSSILESTPSIHYPTVRVPHEDSVYAVLIPHLAMAPTGAGVLHAILACAASHTRQRILGMKNYHLAVRAVREDTEKGVTYFVAVTLLGMYEVLGGKGIRCMYLARDWMLEHKEELKSRQRREGVEVTVRDVIIEHMMWTFARTAIHRGLSSLPSIAPREGFLLPMSDFRELYIPREGGDSTVGVADNLVVLLAQLLSLPTLGEFELKSHIANQLFIWPSTLPRTFRQQWTSNTNISTTSLSAMHFLHPSIAAINLLHRAGIIYFSIYFNFNVSRKSSPEAISAARDVLRITQPLIDEASSGRWSVLGALTLAFGPVFVAGQFLKFHLRDTPFVVPPMDWLDESFGEIVETEEDVELREVERMIDRLKTYLGGVEGRVFEL